MGGTDGRLEGSKKRESREFFSLYLLFHGSHLAGLAGPRFCRVSLAPELQLTTSCPSILEAAVANLSSYSTQVTWSLHFKYLRFLFSALTPADTSSHLPAKGGSQQPAQSRTMEWQRTEPEPRCTMPVLSLPLDLKSSPLRW